MGYQLISADNHIIEPRDLFTNRMPTKFRDRAPRVVAGADGGDGWTWNGKPPARTFGIEAIAGRGSRISGYKWEDILPGNYDGAAHMADMKSAGVDAAVIFPATSIEAYVEEDREFALAAIRAYNDWMFEDFESVDPKRIVGLGMLPVDDGNEAAIAELHHCLKKGARGFFIPAFPHKPYYDTSYDPLWKEVAAAGVPVCLHRTFGGKNPAGGFQPNVPGVNVGGTVIRFFSSIDTLTYMVYTGVFKRHPNLRLLAAEVNFGWVPFWKQTLDQCFEQQKSWARFPIDSQPSAVLGKNVFVAVLDDMVGFDFVNKDPQLADMAMFSVDYPHSICLWPDTATKARTITAGISVAHRDKVLAGNAARVFGLQ